MIREWQVTTDSFCCLVVTNSDGKIIDTAPMLKIFLCQPFPNLEKWLSRKFGRYELRSLNDAIST